MADAWATTSKQLPSEPLLGPSLERTTTSSGTSTLVNESTLLPDTPGLRIPSLRRSSAFLVPPIARPRAPSADAPISTVRRSTKRPPCAEPESSPSAPWDDSLSARADGSGRVLSAVGEDVDTDALAEHLFAVIRSAEAALAAIGFEADVDSVGADMDAADLDATDAGRDSPLV